jgi:enoyl-CoA hydratase/carnithine racemase
VTLNRPEKLNSFNRTMADELSTVWARVRDDEDIRVAVLRASGDRAFCTGIDVAEDAGGSTNRSSIKRNHSVVSSRG